jgi:membrane protease subunit HflK
MPWNDNAKPGPWGSPPTNETPPPRGPRGPVPPAPEENRERFGGRFSDWYRGPNGKPRLSAIATLVAAAIGLWLLTGVYIVQSGQTAIITTLGAYSRDAGPGLHWRLPWPIERAEVVPSTVQRTDVGSANPENEEESLMLTTDGDLVDLPFSVIWRVSDPHAFAFNLDDVDKTIATVGETAMREAVGRTAYQPLFSTGRDEVQAETAAAIQRVLDRYHAGVHVDAVQIGAAAAPRQTMEAFRELETARQNSGPAVQAANVQAGKVEQEAAANKARTIQEAQAEAARFTPVYEEYKAAPAVTRERLYIETMKRLLSRANKVVVTGKDATVTLPAPKATPEPATEGGK